MTRPYEARSVASSKEENRVAGARDRRQLPERQIRSQGPRRGNIIQVEWNTNGEAYPSPYFVEEGSLDLLKVWIDQPEMGEVDSFDLEVCQFSRWRLASIRRSE